jgi:hypothetical protein
MKRDSPSPLRGARWFQVSGAPAGLGRRIVQAGNSSMGDQALGVEFQVRKAGKQEECGQAVLPTGQADGLEHEELSGSC